MKANKILTALFLVLLLSFIPGPAGNAQAAASASSPFSIQQFFKTPEESKLHWKTCTNHVGGILVPNNDPTNNSDWMPDGTFIAVLKIENDKGATIYGTTQAHAVAKDLDEKTFYSNIQVWFRAEQFDAKVIKIAPKPLDLALIKVFIPKSWVATNPLYNGARTYREMIDRIVPVTFISKDIIPDEGDAFWMVGYAGGGIPRRVLARFLWYAEAPNSGYTFGLYFFVLEEGAATGGHSGSYILDSSCNIVIGGLSEGLNEGEGMIAIQSFIIQKFISDGLKKENIVWP